ncbi:hypothetical protein OG967_39910 [Streptomyces phaeochromogenes]
MSKQLTTLNATVTTASVELNTLTISGRQVTLAVFRQLREEPLIAQDGTLNGVPWGTVNYHPDKCTDGKEHLHVVWQRGAELRRASVQPPAGTFHEHPLAGWYVHVRVLAGLTCDERDPDVRAFARQTQMESARAWVRVAGLRFHSTVSNACASAYELGLHRDRAMDEMRAQLAGAPADLDVSAEALRARLESVATAYTESWRALDQLPQLFIAV